MRFFHIKFIIAHQFDSFHLNSVLKNSLRGFPLNGCQFKVPESHRGIVFQEDHRPLDENAERTFKVSGIFNEFTYWNYDKVPSDNDKLKQALGWNEFAKAVRITFIDFIYFIVSLVFDSAISRTLYFFIELVMMIGFVSFLPFIHCYTTYILKYINCTSDSSQIIS